MLGECNKETAFQILDAFYEAGGNFIDTANFYQNEQSETWLGDWVAERKNRDELVLATKYTMSHRMYGPEKIRSNFQGNHAKSMRLAVDASLKKLHTDYIDILYVHVWDYTTSVEELMTSLNNLVVAGKVLYLAISDTPAWLVVKCNECKSTVLAQQILALVHTLIFADARFHGLTRFSVYQGHWSCAFRDLERDIIPMCQSEGMALAPWGVLGRGQFKSAESYQREGRKMGGQSEKHRRVGEKLDELAKKKNTLPTSIAIAYVMHKVPYVFPVVGGRKVEHIKGNIEALSVELTAEEINEIDDAEPFDVGFPLSFAFETPKQKYRTDMTARHIWQLTCNTRLETVPKLRVSVPVNMCC